MSPRTMHVELPPLHPKSEPLDASEEALRLLRQHIDSEPARIKRVVRGSMLTAGVVAGIISSAVMTWGSIEAARINSKTQLLIAQQQQADRERPSTEATFSAGFTAGSKATVDEQLRRLQAKPSPINLAADLVALKSQR